MRCERFPLRKMAASHENLVASHENLVAPFSKK
jgi:hypothetical protein